MQRQKSNGARAFGRRLLALAGALTLGAASASASPGGLLIADGGFGGILTIQEHDVSVVINNGIAVTEIDQVFLNTEDRIVEALYTFPVPKNASVSGFSMWIDGKEMVGEVLEKERAREIYESYKARRVDPGLLEQTDYKTFEMRIFPIPAGAEQRVRVSYYQELDVDDDWATYVYPLATSTRASVDTRVHGRFSLSIEAKSEVPIAAMESPSHTDFLFVEHTSEYHQASLELQGGDLARDVVVAYRAERGTTGLDLVTSKAKGEDGFFQLTLTAGPELEQEQDGMDYVFVGDVSGSMGHDGKLNLSNRAVVSFLEQLGPRDRFEVIAFNIAPESLNRKLTAVGNETVGDAMDFLASLEARGGTQLRPAIEAAYRYVDPDRTLNVVVLSDGMTEATDLEELLALIRERPGGVRVFCVGIGNEVNRPLLQQMAEDAGGLAAFVSHGDDFARQAKGFRRKLTRPAMTDVVLTVEGAGAYDVEPGELPDLFHGAPVRIYGRYGKSGPARISLSANVLGRAHEQVFEIELPAVDASSPEIERMWAWHRVQGLMDQERAKGSSDRLRADIVELCEGYSIASEYASFLVLENNDEYRRWKIERRNAARIERDRAAQSELRRQLDDLRSQAADALGPIAPDAPVANADGGAGADRSTSAPAANRAPTGNALDVVTSPRRAPAFGGRGGGGSFGPWTAGLAWGVAMLAWAVRRRRGA
ncbi:MAG: VIT and VWA domain-containing protein [Planctomycetota bacterium]